MANLYVTFGRAIGSPPLMIAATCRSAKLVIAAGETDSVVTTLAADDTHNAVDLYAEASCWVDIGPDADAGEPGVDGNETSFFMASGERNYKVVDEHDKVSVVAAA